MPNVPDGGKVLPGQFTLEQLLRDFGMPIWMVTSPETFRWYQSFPSFTCQWWRLVYVRQPEGKPILIRNANQNIIKKFLRQITQFEFFWHFGVVKGCENDEAFLCANESPRKKIPIPLSPINLTNFWQLNIFENMYSAKIVYTFV